MARLAFFASLFIFLGTISGQQTSHFQFKYLQQGQAIEELKTNCILTDQLGVLWVGGNKGIKYYDGVNLKSFEWTSSSNSMYKSVKISSFAEDCVGRLWVGTDTGLVILSTDRSYSVLPSVFGIPDSISKATNFYVQSDKAGNVLFMSGQKLYRANADSNTFDLVADIGEYRNNPGNLVYFLYVPREDAFYIVSSDSKIYHFKEHHFKSINYPLCKSGSNKPEYLLNYSLELLWLVQDSLFLLSHNLITQKTYPVQLDHKRKLAFYDPASSAQEHIPVIAAWQSYCFKPGSVVAPGVFSDIYVRQLLQGSHGCWYVATNIGVFIAQENIPCFQPVSWTRGYSTRAITQAQDELLVVGSYNQLLYGYLNDSTCRQIHSSPPWFFFQKGSRSWDIFAETPYSAYHIDLSRLDKPLLKKIPSENPLGFCPTAVASGEGYWLAGAPYTVQYFNPKKKTAFIYSAPSFMNNIYIYHYNKKLLIHNKILWAGGDSGLQSYRLNNEGNKVVEELTTALPDTLRKLDINCLYLASDDKIWIGSAVTGLWAYHPQHHTLQHWLPADGLAHENVYSIIGSHSDSLLWIGTQHGLSRMDVPNNTFCNYHTPDGLLSNEFNTTSTYKSSKGYIFMGGPNGVSYFRPEDVPIKPAFTSGFVIIEVQNSKQHSYRKIFPLPGSTLTLQPEDDHMALMFRSTDFFKDQDITFRYLLEGLHNEWRYVSLDQQEIFVSMKPGAYELVVQTQSNTGAWTTVYTLNLDILPAWHQTIWFKVFLTILLILFLQGLYTLRLRQLRKEYDMRKQVSDDLHDDLGSRIFALKAMASKVARPNQPEGERRVASEQFESLSKEVLSRVREFIWVFDPKHDQLIHFLDRLDDYIQITIRPLVKSINFSYYTEKRHRFASTSRHHLMMILQELLINMSKHTLEPVIQVKAFLTDSSTLHIVIHNHHSGITASPGTDHNSYGLASIEKRLNQYDIRFNWNEDTLCQSAELSVKISKTYV